MISKHIMEEINYSHDKNSEAEKDLMLKKKRRKTNYQKINNETRQKLIEMVVNL
jgi:hypothetical protein